MGILVKDNEERTKLQDRINSDLRERSRSTSKNEGDDVDLVDDSEFIKNTRTSHGAGIFWGTLIVLALISLGIIFFLR